MTHSLLCWPKPNGRNPLVHSSEEIDVRGYIVVLPKRRNMLSQIFTRSVAFLRNVFALMGIYLQLKKLILHCLCIALLEPKIEPVYLSGVNTGVSREKILLRKVCLIFCVLIPRHLYNFLDYTSNLTVWQRHQILLCIC